MIQITSNGDDRNRAESGNDWRSVGLPDRAIEAARSALSSPDQAKLWVDALQHFVPKPDVLRSIVAAGIEPDEFVRWRVAGVDSWNIVSWSKLLHGAGLGPEHVERWRAAHLNVPTLPLIVPYLAAEFAFDDVLEILETWDVRKSPGSTTPRAEELLRVLQAGIDVGDLVRLRRDGVTGAALLRWCSSGVPAADWAAWMSSSISAETASKFFAVGVAPHTAAEWMDTGLSALESLTLIERKVPLSRLREWIAAGVSPSDAASFLGVGASLGAAREWSAANLSAKDAALFIAANVPLEEARPWIESATELSARDCVDFIEKRVSLTEAIEFERRGIDSGQVTRTDEGLVLDLDPWQEDPADQLPDVIGPGHFNLLLWSMAAGGDYVAYDVAFTWDGHRGADWYQDISMTGNELSFASSSPIHGTAAWPDGLNVDLTYEWPEMGYQGTDALNGLAPTSANPESDDGARDPQSWIRLGYALIEWVYRTF